MGLYIEANRCHDVMISLMTNMFKLNSTELRTRINQIN